MIIIGSARIAENGTINGNKGDQTGREVATEEYYRHRFDWFVLRHKDPNKALMMSYDMASACNNDNFGYSQSDRYSGLYEAKRVGYDCSKVQTRCNVDCSSLVRICVQYAGVEVGDFYTGNEYTVLMETGAFEDVTNQIDQDTGEGLCSGDILVSQSRGHTAIVTEGKDPRPEIKPEPAPEPAPTMEPYPVDDDEVAIYRLYNPNSGEHLLTAIIEEANALLGFGWKSEGVAFIAPKESDTVAFRMYATMHTFVAEVSELHALVESGWHFEGVAFHSGGNVPVYRVYNPTNGDHLFTVDEAEKNRLLAVGCVDEGVRFYAIRAN